MNAILGFILPLPIYINFLEMISHNPDTGAMQNVSMPLSVILIPIVLFKVISAFRNKFYFPKYILNAVLLFLLWSLILVMLSSVKSYVVWAYFIEWCFPIIWLIYGGMLASKPAQFRVFGKAFFIGSLVAASLICFEVMLEFVQNGHLSGGGKIIDHTIIPVLYQVNNYTPLAIVISCFLSIALVKSEVIRVRPSQLVILYLLSLVAVLFTGARGPFLVFSICSFFAFTRMSFGEKLAWSSIAILLLILLFVLLQDNVSFSLFDKFQANFYGDKPVLGTRDLIAGKYFDVYMKSPLSGTAMLPPIIAFPESVLIIKSAHNYYLDVLVWTGPLGLALVLAILMQPMLLSIKYSIFSSLKMVNVNHCGQRLITMSRFLKFISPVIMCVMLISNNLRVPMRESLTAQLIFLLMGLLISSHSYVQRAMYDKNCK